MFQPTLEDETVPVSTVRVAITGSGWALYERACIRSGAYGEDKTVGIRIKQFALALIG